MVPIEPEVLARVARLLPGVARLVVRGTEVGDEQVQLLLLALDVDPAPSTLHEIERWVRLLRRVRDSEDREFPDIVAEGLMARGLPQAPILEAMSILRKSDTLQVTRHVIPGTDLRADVDLPANPPHISTPQVAAAAEYKVTSDGQGTHTTLVAALQAAVPGTTIRLGPGTFPMQLGYVLQQPIRLIGMGHDTSVIVFESGEANQHQGLTIALGGTHTTGADPLTICEISDLTLQCEEDGGTRSFMLKIENSSATVARCRIACRSADTGVLIVTTGTLQSTCAVRDCTVQGGVHGIVINGDGEALISENDCRGQSLTGITCVGSTRGMVRGNSCSDAHMHGIAIGARSTVTLQTNTCTRNGVSGIAVFNSAQPILTDNQCGQNRGSGIVILDRASTHSRTNNCADNGEHGILNASTGSATLDGNTCERNAMAGIAQVGTGHTDVLRNTCQANGAGIIVAESASPNVRENNTAENVNSGIVVQHCSGGVIGENISRANGRHGILLRDHAAPLVEGNTTEDNACSGVRCEDEAQGTVRSNLCTGNGEYGVVLTSSTGTQLGTNSCTGNKQGNTSDQREESPFPTHAQPR